MAWGSEASARHAAPPQLTAARPDTTDPAVLSRLTTLEVLRALETSPRGLDEPRAQRLLERYGENTPPTAHPPGRLRRFARSLRDPFSAVLLVLGVVSAAVSAWATAAVITVLVVISCVLRSAGEHRAERAAAGLRELVAATATVRRRPAPGAEPRVRELPVDQLVPGDVVLLGPGDVVPADVRLLRATGLTVHQPALTGESAPVTRNARDTPGATPSWDLPGQRHLCLQGGSVATGSGTGVVVATGAGTFWARQSRPVPRRTTGGTVFHQALGGVSWTLIRLMLCAAALVLAAHTVLRGPALDTVPLAVAVAVALTPEMLPVVVNVSLARGAVRLAGEHAVMVRRLPALHDLGAMEVLCTDKTGTLTRDRPVLHSAFDPWGRPDPEVLGWAAVNAHWTLHLAELPAPDPLDEAILRAGGPGDPDPGDPCGRLTGLAALPFDPVRRRATAVVREPDHPGTHTVVVKGAVEEVLPRCTRLRTEAGGERALDEARRPEVLALAERQAAAGLRLLAVAMARRPGRTVPAGLTPESAERELTLLGFVALRDELAPGAAEALSVLARQGIAVKVLTGDHPATAARACRDLGLDPGPPGTVVTGAHTETLDDAELAELAATRTVFARCTPAHKARVVEVLRAAGHPTGFLGDGVNDLPALHAADVGICPLGAADVTRAGADVVLAGKDFTAIGRAVTCGRDTTRNITTYLRVVLSSNLGNVIAMMVAGLLLPFLPMLPLQVLVQNLCFDAAQLAFAFDRAEPRAGARDGPTVLRPRAFTAFVLRFGALNAAADLGTFAALGWLLSLPSAAGLDTHAVFHAGWFTENLLTQALVIWLLRPGSARRMPPPLVAAVAGLTAIGLLLPLSPLAPALGLTATLPGAYYPLLGVVLVLYAGALGFIRARYRGAISIL
ncbi:magnesium-translocating P-type ATPase [Streptomyces xiamenensis]|uniref:magnesium-translocating P-type ATPase n=1 Tax=Streptomyces xiamenensis TaxID=408015 RepID=UPI003448ACD8